MSQLNLIDKAFALKDTVLFGTLDLDHLLGIADKADIALFHDGDKIFYPHHEANRIYVIVKGDVLIRDDKQNLLATLSAGEVFGDEALFSNGIRAYEATSRGEALLLTMVRTTLHAAITECPAVALNLLQQYAATNPFRQRTTQKSPLQGSC